MSDVMLTTVDNPWNPFTQFNEWFTYDMQQGYNTCGLLAKKAAYSTKVNDEFNDFFILESMKEIANDDLRGIYIIVSPESYRTKPIQPVPGI